MSGPQKDAQEKSVQDFLQRWSRRKLGIAEAEEAAQPTESSQTGEPQPAARPVEAAPEPQAPFDLASLPPIESIDATTDIRAFLAPGVPVELTRAALRRAWTSDPTIRDFVGMAENQWDFTNPDAVPGFGSLEFTEEVRAMVSRLFGETSAEAAQEPAAKSETSVADRGEAAALSAAEVPAPVLATPTSDAGTTDHAALQKESRAEEPERTPRKHGAALPK